MAKRLLVVNQKDQIIRTDTVEKCHKGKGILHRAFTVFIFNDKGQLLIQQRSKFKKLWPLFWETSCSSHPQKRENCLEVAKKRLKEELGIKCPPQFLTKFRYQAPYKKIGSENEICWLLVGKYNGKISADQKEINNWKWVSLKELAQDVKKTKNKNKYTPWLKIGLEKYLKFKWTKKKKI